MGQNVSPDQRRILEFVALADGEGSTLAHDIASELELSPRGMGGRMAGLEQLGLVSRVLVRARASYRSDPTWAWVLTDEGRKALA